MSKLLVLIGFLVAAFNVHADQNCGKTAHLCWGRGFCCSDLVPKVCPEGLQVITGKSAGPGETFTKLACAYLDKVTHKWTESDIQPICPADSVVYSSSECLRMD